MIESDAVLYISDNWYMNTIKIVENDSGDVIFRWHHKWKYPFGSSHGSRC